GLTLIGCSHRPDGPCFESGARNETLCSRSDRTTCATPDYDVVRVGTGGGDLTTAAYGTTFSHDGRRRLMRDNVENWIPWSAGERSAGGKNGCDHRNRNRYRPH